MALTYRGLRLLLLARAVAPVRCAAVCTKRAYTVHRLLCLPKPSSKVHRGHRQKPRLRHGAVLPTPAAAHPRPASPPDHHLRIALFNCRSVGPALRRSEIAEFIHDNDLDVIILTEAWQRVATRGSAQI
jgi:hypothetical protein